MNILVDAHIFDDKHQGSRTYLKGLYGALIKQAPEWNFYFVAQDVENLKNEFGNGFKNVTYLPLRASNKFHRLLVELPRLIKKYDIDYSHFQYTMPPIKCGKYIVTIHDNLFAQKEFKHYFPIKKRVVNHFLHRVSGQRADVLLTVSEFSKQKLHEIYNIANDRIFVTPNGIDPIFYEKKDLASPVDTKYILYVSRIEPRKNHLMLLRAFVETKLYKDYKLVFIGKNDIPTPEMERYIKEHKNLLADRLLRVENISTTELMAYYQNCALFVFPSFAEGFGIPPIEAMALGAKVLVSNATAMSDFELSESQMFDPKNLEALKAKLISQIKNDTRSSQGYEQILSRYHWESIARDFKLLIENHQNQ